MQKVYLLLRDNQQTGPHSLEELLQLSLKKSDLIWIEGKSAGWYYPYEVEALKPYFASAKPVQVTKATVANPVAQASATETSSIAPKKVYVSLPGSSEKKVTTITTTKTNGDYIEQRADQIRKKVQASVETEPVEVKIETPREEPVQKKKEVISKKEIVPEQASPLHQITIDEVPTYAINRTVTEEKPRPKEKIKVEEKSMERSFVPYGIKEETIANISQQKNQKKVADKTTERKKASPFYQYAAAFIFILALIGGGWWLYNSFAGKQQQNEIAKQTATGKPVQDQQVSSTQNTASSNTGTPVDSTQFTNPTANDFNVPLQQTNTNTNSPANKKNQAQKKQQDTKNVVVVPNNTPRQDESTKEQPIVKNDPPPVVEQKKPDPIVAEEPQKKEGFFKKIGNLFKKKNKDEQSQSNDQSKGVDNNNGERNSTRRNDANPTTEKHDPVPTDITDQVDVKISTSNNNWMTGVQGLKLTLKNKSNVLLKKAAVDVIYYNEQGGVIETKRVFFSDVPSKKTQSVAAPDHQYADHAGYKVLTAMGEN